MHFRHISAKIQLKNLKQHFDWGAPWLRPWVFTLRRGAHKARGLWHFPKMTYCKSGSATIEDIKLKLTRWRGSDVG